MEKEKEKKTKFKLVESQKLLLLFQLLNRKNNYGNVCGSITIDSQIDVDRLEKAINKFVEKNDGIRTRICFSGLGFKQYIEKYEPLKIDIIDVESNEDVKRIENEINNEPVSIIRKPLFKVKIFRFKDGRGGIVGGIHHIICDAWTIGLTINEILGYYTDDNAKFDSYSYSEYVDNEKKYFKSDRCAKDEEYWKNLVENKNSEAAVIEGDLNINDKCKECENYSFNIEKNIIDKINDYCKKIQISQCSFFTGIYSLYIGKKAKLNDFMLDTVVLNRTNYKERHTFGLFAKTSTFNAKIENSSFEEYIKNVNKQLLITYRHHKYPMKKILKMTNMVDKNRKRLSKIWFSFQNAKIDKSNIMVPYTARWTPLKTTYLYDMLIELYNLNNDGSINIIYYYNQSKYSEKRIKEIHNEIYSIIKQVINNSYINIEGIEINDKMGV